MTHWMVAEECACGERFVSSESFARLSAAMRDSFGLGWRWRVTPREDGLCATFTAHNGRRIEGAAMVNTRAWCPSCIVLANQEAKHL